MSSRYRFVTANDQSIVNIICEWMHAILNARSPSFSSVAPGSFLYNLRDRLQFFCTTRDLVTGTIHVGQEAIQILYKQMEEKLTKKDAAVDMEQLRVFHTYNWLLKADEQDSHRNWCNDICKKVGAPVSAAAPPSSSSASSSSKPPVVNKKDIKIREATLDLFKKRKVI